MTNIWAATLTHKTWTINNWRPQQPAAAFLMHRRQKTLSFLTAHGGFVLLFLGCYSLAVGFLVRLKMHVCEMKSFANLVYVSGGQFFLVALQQSFHFISFLASNVWLTQRLKAWDCRLLLSLAWKLVFCWRLSVADIEKGLCAAFLLNQTMAVKWEFSLPQFDPLPTTSLPMTKKQRLHKNAIYKNIYKSVASFMRVEICCRWFFVFVSREVTSTDRLVKGKV